MKYEEIMDRIEVTPEMRQRILHNLETEQQRIKKHRFPRQLLALAACLVLAVCCWFIRNPKQADDPEQGVLFVNQIENVDSLQALSEKTGIPLSELSGLPFSADRTEYVSYWENLAEIQYFGGTDSLCYRKSAGTEDNSGDHNSYSQVETRNISGKSVTLKGENDAFTLATWTDGSYAYSISVTAPLTRAAFEALITENFS